MSSAKIQVLLELDHGAEPIAGSLQQPGSDPTQFSGWLQLTQLLETIRNSTDGERREAK